MSQSDYIKHKRVAAELVNQSKLPPMLDAGDYTSFLGYNLENTILNTKPDLNQLIPTTSQLVFDMKLQVKACPSFIACNLTNTRPNRVLDGNGTPPYVTPISPLTDKQLTKYINTTIQASDLCKCSNI